MNGIDTFMDVQTCSVSCVGTAMFLADTRKVIALQTPPPTRCTRKRCVAVALPLLLAVSGPQARAADFARPPEQTVLVDRQPPASATENTPAAPRQQAQSSDDGVSRTVQSAAIGTVVSIFVAGAVCLLTSGALCMFPM